MRKTKFTPGPWQVVDDKTSLLIAPTNGEPSVAFTYVAERGKQVLRNRANANLIAAAPELYELVNTLLLVTVNGIDPKAFREIRNECLEVMAKARGEG